MSTSSPAPVPVPPKPAAAPKATMPAAAAARPAAAAKPAPVPRPTQAAASAPAKPPAAQQPAESTKPKAAWHAFFEDWPEEIPTRGIVVTHLNEPCQFKAFMLRSEFVVLERVTPDSMGGRFLVLKYDEIAALKFTDPLKQPSLEAAGFKGQLAK